MSPEEAEKSGCIFYKLPSELVPEDVDPLIRKAVFRINESGWIWTAESCQGHPDMVSMNETSWSHNVRPMVRLVTQEALLGKALAFLCDSMTVHCSELDIPRTLGFEVFPNDLTKNGYKEVLIYVNGQTAYDRNLGIRALEQFAESVNLEKEARQQDSKKEN